MSPHTLSPQMEDALIYLSPWRMDQPHGKQRSRQYRALQRRGLAENPDGWRLTTAGKIAADLLCARNDARYYLSPGDLRRVQLSTSIRHTRD